MREDSEWVGVSPRASEGVGSHFWLPLPLSADEGLGAAVDDIRPLSAAS